MRIAAKERQYRNPAQYAKVDNQRVQPKVRYPRMKNRSIPVRDTALAPRKRNYQTYRGNRPRRQTWRRVCRYGLVLLLAALVVYLFLEWERCSAQCGTGYDGTACHFPVVMVLKNAKMA